MDQHYTREVKMPRDRKEGLMNAVKADVRKWPEAKIKSELEWLETKCGILRTRLGDYA